MRLLEEKYICFSSVWEWVIWNATDEVELNFSYLLLINLTSKTLNVYMFISGVSFPLQLQRQHDFTHCFTQPGQCRLPQGSCGPWHG